MAMATRDNTVANLPTLVGQISQHVNEATLHRDPGMVWYVGGAGSGVTTCDSAPTRTISVLDGKSRTGANQVFATASGQVQLCHLDGSPPHDSPQHVGKLKRGCNLAASGSASLALGRPGS